MGTMEPPIVADDSLSSNTAFTAFNVLLIAAAMMTLYAIRTALLVLRKFDSARYPPVAEGGFRKHMAMAMSTEMPFWLLEQCNRLNTRIFQLTFPVSATNFFFIISDMATFRQIMTDPTTEKPSRLYNKLNNISGSSTILTLNGEPWQSKRKAAAHAFSSRHIRRMSTVALVKTEAWIEQTLSSHVRDGTPFDVSKEMLTIILAQICETAFEYQMSHQEANDFKINLDLALDEFTKQDPVNPLRKYMPASWLPDRQRAIVAVDWIRNLIERMVEQYNKSANHVEGSVIQLIMQSDRFASHKEKVAQLYEFLLAGHDTTAYSIAWILKSLADHPDEQSRLRVALRRSADNWSQCEELKCVIKEGMRLRPVARSIRVLGRDVVTADKKVLPAGSIAAFHFLPLFRDPAVFDKPDEFVPGRWVNPTKAMTDFAPFAMGKQNCMGQSLAQSNMLTIVARIISAYELSVVKEGKAVYNLTLKPTGVLLRARKL
mmetsp:Transcript_14204/g.32649  ORF Transcript_14204/g.32649 Transcript_14204/m.32649 type:complete len:488 (+) Transcript_14204:407-1870(+)